MDKITVSAGPLRQLLAACLGPSHYIRELQALNHPPFDIDNPIKILTDEYNAAVEQNNQQRGEQDGKADSK